MDPTHNPTVPEPDTPSGDEPHASHKKIFIIIATTIGLIVMSVIIAVLFTWPGVEEEQPKQQYNAETRINRPGYSNVADTIGDPAALIQKTYNEAITYKPDTTIIDACSLLPLQTIKEHDLLVSPGEEAGTMSRHFFDGNTKTIEPYWRKQTLLPQELNDCRYPLTVKGGGSLYVAVYQPAYAGGVALRKALDDYLIRGGQIGDVTAYDRTRTPIQDNRTFYFLERNDVYVNVEIDLGEEDSETTITSLLESVAGRFSDATKTPKKLTKYTYESPTFSGEYISACDISKAGDVASLFGAPASASLQERLATSTGVTTPQNEPSNYIENECVRRTAGKRAIADHLSTKTLSFENEQAAQAFAGAKHTSSAFEPRKKQKVGDESFFLPATGSTEHTFVFRTDQTVVMLSMYGAGGKGLTVPQRIEKLSAVAQAMFKRMTPAEDTAKQKTPGSNKPSAQD